MFSLQKKSGVEFYTIDSFSNTSLTRHCFTTRHGGVSDGIYKSMNLRINCDDKKENIDKNFDIICNAIGTKKENLVLSNQVHEDNAISVTKKDCGNGILFENQFESADALITDERNVCLVTFFADCVPIYLLDVEKKVIALVHSGWKGTVAEISKKTIEKLKKDYHCKPENMLAAIGPSIHQCHFEVGTEVCEIFESKFGEKFVKTYEQKPHVDLQGVIFSQLLESGLKRESITHSEMCTYCNCERFFSHRKTQGKRGTMAAFLELV